MSAVDFFCPRCLRSFVVTADLLPLHCCCVRYESLDDVLLIDPDTPRVVERCPTCTTRRRFMAGHDPGCPKCSKPGGIRSIAELLGQGPGTALREILKSIAVHPSRGCGCMAVIVQMNRWGQEGCIDNINLIVDHLRKVYAKTDWTIIMRANWAAISTGLAWELDWTDPLTSLVHLALVRDSASRT